VVSRMKKEWPQARYRAQFMLGLRDALPALIATATWGLVSGIAIVKSGLSEALATFMTLTVYAGSAQLTALPLIKEQVPLWLIFAAGLVVNIRFVIFGAALQPFFRHLSWPKRFWLGFFSTDIGFVMFMKRYGESTRRGDPLHLWYLLGVIGPGWIAWNGASLIGIMLAGVIPAEWSIEFAAILALLAIVVPLVSTRPVAICMLAAGGVAWVGQAWPLRLGLAAAVVAGILAGVASERFATKSRQG
jgi:Predicted branched-chain amino acid permease (azaleucine resistance)